MISYPTTLLPSSPPYRTYSQIIDSLCDECMKSQYDDNLNEYLKQQMFDYTMALIEFWHHELIDRGIYLEDF